MSPREFQGEPSQQGGAFILGPGQFDNGWHNVYGSVVNKRCTKVISFFPPNTIELFYKCYCLHTTQFPFKNTFLFIVSKLNISFKIKSGCSGTKCVKWFQLLTLLNVNYYYHHNVFATTKYFTLPFHEASVNNNSSHSDFVKHCEYFRVVLVHTYRCSNHWIPRLENVNQFGICSWCVS